MDAIAIVNIEPENFDADLQRQITPLERRIAQLSGLSVVLILAGFVWVVIALSFRQDAWSVTWFSALFQGPVAATWALAGVILIYVAFLGQRLQLLYQQQELRDTRAELRGQKEEFQIQHETSKRHRFENTFFQMLALHHEIVRALAVGDTRDSGRHLSGRTTFEHVMFKFRSAYFQLEEIPEGIGRAEAAWDLIYHMHQGVLGHYFRNLYHIFKYVKESEIEDKRRYTSLARAQLSTRELCLLFYNCTVGYGSDKFLPLALEFELFENLPDTELLNLAHVSFTTEKRTETVWPTNRPFMIEEPPFQT